MIFRTLYVSLTHLNNRFPYPLFQGNRVHRLCLCLVCMWFVCVFVCVRACVGRCVCVHGNKKFCKTEDADGIYVGVWSGGWM